MTDWPPHFCPGCGESQKPFARYPWYFCQGCLDRATDRDGRRLSFFNASLSGGLGFRAQGLDGWWEAQPVLCFIDRRPVLVHEARFGGVVAEPIRDVAQDLGPHGVNMKLRDWAERATDRRRG